MSILAGAVRPNLNRRWLVRAVTAGALAAGLCAVVAPGAAGAASNGTEPPLVVYSSEGYDSYVVHEFEQKTGIPAEVNTNTLPTLAADIQATKENPTWGVLWTDGSTEMATLDAQHLLVRNLKPKVSWNTLGLAAVAKDKSFVPTGVTLTAALLYTKNIVTDPPASWLQLLSPQWKGEVAVATPKQVGSVYPFIAGLITQVAGKKGVSKGEKYFTQLKANGLVVHTTTSQTIEAVTSGKAKLALVQSSVAIGAQRSNPNLAVSYLPSVTVLPSTIGIDAKAPKKIRADALAFIDYVLSPTGQKAMQAGTRFDDSNYYPVTNGTQPLPTLPALSTIQTRTITPYVWAKRQAAITTWFVKHVTH